MKEIGKTILDSRKEKGITQEELADLAKVNLRTIQRLENNKNIPRVKTLKLVCDVLEINSNELIKSTSKFHLELDTILTIFFLLTINITVISIIGFLTIDSEANFNSRFGAFILSFLIPIFIINLTKEMSNNERFLKFGLGYLLYLVGSIFILGFPLIFVFGLLLSLLIAIFTMYYGNQIIRKNSN
jgi:transcriptional regulator with XRE-family HTH domain